MNAIDLEQEIADALIAVPKVRANDEETFFPYGGEHLSLPLQSQDGRESFSLDIRRGRFDLSKATYQNRARQIVVLVRLDFGGPPHRNPDGEEIPCPHLHIYREGYGDKWAFEVPSDVFPQLQDLWQALQDFMHYCNIIDPPDIQRGLL